MVEERAEITKIEESTPESTLCSAYLFLLYTFLWSKRQRQILDFVSLGSSMKEREHLYGYHCVCCPNQRRSDCRHCLLNSSSDKGVQQANTDWTRPGESYSNAGLQSTTPGSRSSISRGKPLLRTDQGRPDVQWGQGQMIIDGLQNIGVGPAFNIYGVFFGPPFQGQPPRHNSSATTSGIMACSLLVRLEKRSCSLKEVASRAP